MFRTLGTDLGRRNKALSEQVGEREVREGASCIDEPVCETIRCSYMATAIFTDLRGSLS